MLRKFSIALIATLAAAPAAAQAAITVNSTGDAFLLSGSTICYTGALNAAGQPECTMRAAVDLANRSGGGTIEFDIPGNDPGWDGTVFRIAAGFSNLTSPTSVLGYTQPGATRNTLINGSNAQPLILLEFGLTLSGDGSLVEGLILQGVIRSNRAADVTIRGNFIVGFVDSYSPGSTGLRLGGPLPGDRNVIDGRAVVCCDGSLVQANLIGIAADGTTPFGSGQGNPLLRVNGQAEIIGNVISGGLLDGIQLYGDGSLVTGNRIGTDAAGTSPVGNAAAGIVVGGSNAVIGGPTASDRNLIAASGTYGILAHGANVRIENNDIFSGALDGIRTMSGSAEVIDNEIHGNDGAGVRVDLGGRVTILGNSTHGNAQLGISLGSTPNPTPNDPGDGDSGPNDLQNFPVLTAVGFGGGSGSFSGTLDSPPGTYTLEFFSTVICDPSGHGEGYQPLGRADVTIDASGAFDVSGLSTPPPGQGVFTATATNAAGGTSEFSACVASLAHLTMLKTADVTQPTASGPLVRYTVTLTNDGTAEATDIVVQENFPPSLEFVGYDSLPPTSTVYDPQTGVWSVDSLDAGATATLFVSGRLVFGLPGGLIPNSAVVTACNGCNPNDPPASSSVTVPVGGADLSVAMMDDPDPVPSQANDVGDITYTVVIGNVALSEPATDVELTFSASHGRILSISDAHLDTTCEIDPADDRNALCTIASAMYDESRTIEFVVSPPGGITVTADASVTGTAYDPDPANNGATEQTVVEAGDAVTNGVLPFYCAVYLFYGDDEAYDDCLVNACFIATAAYGSHLDPHVGTLRGFRDRWLLTHAPGRVLVDLYYRSSPPLAAWIARNETRRILARLALTPIVYTIEYPAAAALLSATLGLAGLLLVRRRRRSARRRSAMRTNAPTIAIFLALSWVPLTASGATQGPDWSEAEKACAAETGADLDDPEAGPKAWIWIADTIVSGEVVEVQPVDGWFGPGALRLEVHQTLKGDPLDGEEIVVTLPTLPKPDDLRPGANAGDPASDLPTGAFTIFFLSSSYPEYSVGPLRNPLPSGSWVPVRRHGLLQLPGRRTGIVKAVRAAVARREACLPAAAEPSPKPAQPDLKDAAIDVARAHGSELRGIVRRDPGLRIRLFAAARRLQERAQAGGAVDAPMLDRVSEILDELGARGSSSLRRDLGALRERLPELEGRPLSRPATPERRRLTRTPDPVDR